MRWQLLEFSPDELRHLPHHFLEFGQAGMAEAIVAEHAYVLLPHLPASLTVGRESSHAHTHDIFPEVGYAEITRPEIAEQEVGIGGNLVALVVDTLATYRLTADVARGMQRQPAVAHLEGGVCAAYPVAHYLLRVVGTDEQAVAIQKIGLCLFQLSGDVRNGVAGEEEIVGVYQSDVVAGGDAQSLVERLVHAAVRLGNNLYTETGVRLSEGAARHLVGNIADDVEGTVSARSVHHNILYVRKVL